MDTKSVRHIILASGSPRRRDILTAAGYEFEVKVSGLDEVITKSEPQEIVEELSAQKAGNVYDDIASGLPDNYLIIGADTIVVHNGKIMGKPADEADAVRMLKELSGDTHQVYTGVTCIFDCEGEVKRRTFTACTDVYFDVIDEERTKAYVATGEPLDKAGAYAIQGGFSKYISGIKGEYNNVVGFPIAAFYKNMKDILG